MITLRTATPSDTPSIIDIAYESWPVTYHFLAEEQVDYMLAEFYNKEALDQLILLNLQEFILLCENNIAMGFAAFSLREGQPGVYKLNKLYVYSPHKGKGWGRLLIAEVEKRVIAAGGHTLELNVNRYNASKDFYLHLGYEVAYEEDIPIGKYWMNDYVMRKQLRPDQRG